MESKLMVLKTDECSAATCSDNTVAGSVESGDFSPYSYLLIDFRKNGCLFLISLKHFIFLYSFMRLLQELWWRSTIQMKVVKQNSYTEILRQPSHLEFLTLKGNSLENILCANVTVVNLAIYLYGSRVVDNEFLPTCSRCVHLSKALKSGEKYFWTLRDLVGLVSSLLHFSYVDVRCVFGRSCFLFYAMGSSGDIGPSNTLFVRHSMKINFVAGLNAILSEEQKCVISKTPFAWFLELQDNLKIGRNILSDLLIIWVDERGGFLFGEKFVEFKELDVTLSLVYHHLLSSFYKACVAWNGGKGATDVYVDGCVYIFKVRFCDYFIASNACVHKYPRILHWMTVSVGDNFIKVAMERGVALVIFINLHMVDEYGTSRKEMGVSSMKVSVKEKEYAAALDEVLKEQDVVIEKLEQELFSLKSESVEEKNKDEVAYSTPAKEHDFGYIFLLREDFTAMTVLRRKDNVESVLKAKPVELPTPDIVPSLIELLRLKQLLRDCVSAYRQAVIAYQCLCTESPTLLPCSDREALKKAVIAYQCLCTESPTLLPGSGRGAPQCVNLDVELRMNGCVLGPTIGEGICVLSVCVSDYRQAVIAYQCVCTESPTMLPYFGRGAPKCVNFNVALRMNGCLLGPTSGEGICVLSACVSDYRQAVIAYQCLCAESPTLLPCSGRGAPTTNNWGGNLCLRACVSDYRQTVIAYQCLFIESPTLLPGSGKGAPYLPVIAYQCLCTESPTLLPCSGRGAPKCLNFNVALRMNGCLLGPTSGEGICVLSACVSDYRQAVIAYQCLCTESPTLLPGSDTKSMDAWEGLEVDEDVLQSFLKKCDSSSSLIPGSAGNVQAAIMNRIIACIVKECFPNGLGDMKLTLKEIINHDIVLDPTGTTKTSLHKKVLKDPNFGPHIGLGCVLILNNVRTFSAFPPNYYVNIVLRNVIKVFAADIGPPTKELMMETLKPVIRPLLVEEPNMAEIMRKMRNPHHQQPSTSKVPDNNNGDNSNTM
ncbi:hypothetical protein V8G54_004886 [Vigna mungo]|uniref:Homologous recombination OB-fold protein OB-fold domain-containing protein n=1 Tax=Vigna mungo TaxID=3915 RepID=A0AAQ3SDF4_VIGMU